MLGEQGKDIGRGQPNAAGRREEYLKCFRSPVIRVCVYLCACVRSVARNIIPQDEDSRDGALCPSPPSSLEKVFLGF